MRDVKHPASPSVSHPRPFGSSCQGEPLDPGPVGASLLPVLSQPIGDERLTARTALRLTPCELEQLRADAAAAGLTVSALIRRRYFGRPVAHRDEAALAAELRRLGGLLKHLHGIGEGIHSASSGTVLELIGHHLRAGLAARKAKGRE